MAPLSSMYTFCSALFRLHLRRRCKAGKNFSQFINHHTVKKSSTTPNKNHLGKLI
jgi:hypothetical protein